MDSCFRCPLSAWESSDLSLLTPPTTRLPQPAQDWQFLPSSVLTPPSLGLSPPPSRASLDSLAFLSPSLPPSPTLPNFPVLASPYPHPHPGFLTPSPLPSVPPLSYFLAITSQRHPDVSPQITSRDLGFRSEILYFCTTGWAPGPRRKTCPLPYHCCLHLLGWDSTLPPGPGLGPSGTLEGLRWALVCPGRVICPWPKCGTAHPYLPGPFVPSPGPPCCMADPLPPSPVIAPP